MQTLAMSQPVVPVQSLVHDTWTDGLLDTLMGRRPDGIYTQAFLDLYLDVFHVATGLEPTCWKYADSSA